MKNHLEIGILCISKKFFNHDPAFSFELYKKGEQESLGTANYSGYSFIPILLGTNIKITQEIDYTILRDYVILSEKFAKANRYRNLNGESERIVLSLDKELNRCKNILKFTYDESDCIDMPQLINVYYNYDFSFKETGFISLLTNVKILEGSVDKFKISYDKLIHLDYSYNNYSIYTDLMLKLSMLNKFIYCAAYSKRIDSTIYIVSLLDDKYNPIKIYKCLNSRSNTIHSFVERYPSFCNNIMDIYNEINIRALQESPMDCTINKSDEKEENKGIAEPFMTDSLELDILPPPVRPIISDENEENKEMEKFVSAQINYNSTNINTPFLINIENGEILLKPGMRHFTFMTVPTIENGQRSYIINDIDSIFTIKDVKFNGPKVIVFWNDGTKTIVSIQDDEDKYDVEKALFAAYTKKIMSFMSTGKERSMNLMLDKWIEKYKKEEVIVKAQIAKVKAKKNNKRKKK